MVQKRAVTYSWWLRFNYALSKIHNLVDHKDIRVINERLKPTKVNIDNFVNRFPAYVIMPTTIGKLGVMAINRANAANIYIGGLIGKAEGGHGDQLVSPAWFFYHDIHTHSVKSINVRSTAFDKKIERFYGLLMEKSQLLSTQERKNIELAFFVLTHEGDGGVFINKPSFEVMSSIHFILESQIGFDFNFKGLMDTSNKSRVLKHVRRISRDFVQMFNEIRPKLQSDYGGFNGR